MLDTHVTIHHGLEARVNELVDQISYKPGYELLIR